MDDTVLFPEIKNEPNEQTPPEQVEPKDTHSNVSSKGNEIQYSLNSATEDD